MKQTTLVLVFNQKEQVMLCMKKRGFGAGKWNGAGGKLEKDETIEQAAARELQEETGVQATPEQLTKRGVFHFRFDDKADWDQDVTLFVMKNYSGTFEETEEMKPAWFDIAQIPYADMWEDDAIWMPRVLAETGWLEYNFYFDENGKIRDHEIIS